MTMAKDKVVQIVPGGDENRLRWPPSYINRYLCTRKWPVLA